MFHKSTVALIHVFKAGWFDNIISFVFLQADLQDFSDHPIATQLQRTHVTKENIYILQDHISSLSVRQSYILIPTHSISYPLIFWRWCSKHLIKTSEWQPIAPPLSSLTPPLMATYWLLGLAPPGVGSGGGPPPWASRIKLWWETKTLEIGKKDCIHSTNLFNNKSCTNSEQSFSCKRQKILFPQSYKNHCKPK